MKLIRVVLLAATFSLHLSMIVTFTKKNRQQRCFVYKSKEEENKTLDIFFSFLSRVKKDQFTFTLTDSITGDDVNIQDDLVTNDNRFFKLNFMMSSLKYKFCFNAKYIIEPVDLELNWKFVQRYADKKQVSKIILLSDKLDKEAKLVKIRLEADYFILKEKLRKFESSNSYLNYATILKIWLLSMVATFQVIFFLRAFKKEKYSKI